MHKLHGKRALVTAVFLASEYDGFITGATLDINGGVYGC